MDITREKMEALAALYQFKLSEEEKDLLEKDFLALEESLEMLTEIDTENVEPMVYPFEEETSYMREDDEIDLLDLDQVLKNAPKKKNSYFSVSKVVE